jgi:hypothetical protein
MHTWLPMIRDPMPIDWGPYPNDTLGYRVSLTFGVALGGVLSFMRTRAQQGSASLRCEKNMNRQLPRRCSTARMVLQKEKPDCSANVEACATNLHAYEPW